MLIYVCLFALGCGGILFEKYAKLDKQFKRVIVCSVMFLALFFTFALRHQCMGIDLRYQDPKTGYLRSFELITGMPLKKVIFMESYQNYERGYIIFNKLVGMINPSRQFFMACCAFCCVAPVAWTIYKRSESPAFSFIVYMGIPYFLCLFSTLRQAIAVGICFLAFSCVQGKRPLLFTALVFLASTFHGTALLFLMVYPAYHVRLSINLRWVSLFALPFVYLHADILIEYASMFITQISVGEGTGAINLFLIFCAIYAFCITVMKNGGVKKRGYRNMLLNKDDEIPKQQGYLNIFWIACAMQAFSGVDSLAMRMAHYYMIILVLLLPSLIMHLPKGKLILIKDESETTQETAMQTVAKRMDGGEYVQSKCRPLTRAVARLGRFFVDNKPVRKTLAFWRDHKKTILLWFIVLCFVLSGLDGLAHTYWSMSYPYYFFWQAV
ncbi:MAG: EpsG family protein [Clostridia bacterium]|nr:EpsG family protein [Clostridia bacterium]